MEKVVLAYSLQLWRLNHAQEHGDCTCIKANIEEVGRAILEGIDGPT